MSTLSAGWRIPGTFLISFCCLFFSSRLSSQFIKTSGPEGGSVACLEKVGDEIWAGTHHGIYTSADNGDSWQIHPEFVHTSCYDILSWGDTIFFQSASADYSETTLYRSTDNGITWDHLPWSVNYSGLFKSGNRLFSKWGMMMQYSNDMGETWNTFPTVPLTFNKINFVNDPGFIFNKSESPTLDRYFYMNSQTLEVTDLGSEKLAVMLTESSSIIALNNQQEYGNHTLLKSDDSGQTWQTAYTFLGVVLGGVVQHEDSLFLRYDYFSDTITICSVNNGGSWTISPYSPANVEFITEPDLLQTAAGEFIGHDMNGVYRASMEDGTPVNYNNSGLAAKYVKSMVLQNDVIYAIGQGTFRSSDFGLTWSPLPADLGQVRDLCIRGDSIIALGHSQGNGTDIPTGIKTSLSTDNGATWTTSFYPEIYLSEPVAIEEVNGKLILIHEAFDYISSDFGVSWTFPAVNWGPSGFFGHNQTLEKDGRILFFTPNSPIIHTWEGNIFGQINTPLLEDPLAISLVDSVLTISGRSSFFRSENDGQTWEEPALNGLPLVDGFVAAPRNVYSNGDTWYTQVFDGARCLGLYVSSDAGENWSLIPGSDVLNASGGLIFPEDILFAGTYASGVWRRTAPMSATTGTVYRDYNGNGIMDAGDYGTEGAIIYSALYNYSISSGTSGNYQFYSDTPGDSIRLALPVPYASVTPEFHLLAGAATERNFGIHLSSEEKELSIDVTNNNVFRPGFQTTLNITSCNMGADVAAATIKCVLDPAVDFVSAIPMYTSLSGDTLIWEMTDFNFFETNEITLVLYTPQTTTLGLPVTCEAWIYPLADDLSPDNNYTLLHSVFVGSYDPNDKTCVEGEYFTPDQLETGEALEYIIRFQNTGTFQADNIRIRDTLSGLHLDLNSFRVISSSHNMRYEMNSEGITDFIFDNIFLPDSFSNELASHGFVKYSIKGKSSLELGDVITNTAYIYFDFNEPIITNTTSTMIGYPIILSINEKGDASENTLLIYPNPAHDLLTIDRGMIADKNLFLQVFDGRGGLMKTIQLSSKENSVPVGELRGGLYLGVVFNEFNESIGNFRFVKN